jgi:hypothetical protein
MKLNYSNIIIFLIIFLGSIFGYYKYLLKPEDGENKILKLVKQMLILIIMFGIIHLYSITENVNTKYIFVLLLAVLINIYSVIRSTKQCNFSSMYILNLVLYSGIITIIMSGLLWYTTNKSLFGFMLNEETKEITTTVSNVFSSNIIDSNINLDGQIDCPDPSDSDNYTTEMSRLHNSDDDGDRQKYNDCLEKEIREDLKKGI